MLIGLLWAGWSVQAAPEPPPAEVLEKSYLFEVARHLFRWHMDEHDVEGHPAPHYVFWVRRLEVARDEGDRSEEAEILLPRVGIAVRVKKADYTIEELGVEVRSPGFRIVNVARVKMPLEAPAGSAVVTGPYGEMREYLFRTRAQADFPDAALFDRLRRALREHVQMDPEGPATGVYEVHVAPLSPVANELWVFIETQKMLVQYSSDADLAHPELWGHAALAVRTYDLAEQTVVSLDEVPGSNEFLTRDQVGRALYNCMVLGRRMVLGRPEADGPDEP
jgi:hypothetical protein